MLDHSDSIVKQNRLKGQILSHIHNFQQLIDLGNTPPERRARAMLLGAIDAVLDRLNPLRLIKDQLHLDGSMLLIGPHRFDLQRFNRVFVIGAGKASASMAAAMNEILGRRIEGGLINVIAGEHGRCGNIILNPTAHPEPDAAGLAGAQQMLQIASAATADDLLICLISGGGSSMLPLPCPGISLDEKRFLTRQLLKSGAGITEINAVRKHISAIKGGALARAAFPATVANLIISDVIGDPLEVIASGPTCADPTTYADAIRILRSYQLWNSTPASIAQHLERGLAGQIPETAKPGAEIFARISNLILANNRMAVACAADFLHSHGIETFSIKHSFDCSAAAAAEEILRHSFTNPQFRAIIGGGETTVAVTGSGKGGRAQQTALALACQQTQADFVFAAFASDGIDGPTDAAGALISGQTITAADAKGLDSNNYLKQNDSYHYFATGNSLIKTGYTGTNVNDIYCLLRF